MLRVRVGVRFGVRVGVLELGLLPKVRVGVRVA